MRNSIMFRALTRIVILWASAVISASAIPAVALECTSSSNIAASRARWATVRSQPANAADNEAKCRSYAASFYESVTLRQAAATCGRDTDREQNLAVLDSEIDAFNNLLATKCSS
jgi:hypothetical protein